MGIIHEDLAYISRKLGEAGADPKVFANRRILITGCAGFLGRLFSSYFAEELPRLNMTPAQVVLSDSFMLGRPEWLDQIASQNQNVKAVEMDIAKPGSTNIDVKKFDYIIHMASIASPTFYRKYPFETLDANVWGLRMLVDACDPQKLRGLLFFSSSEIYGDPDVVPTPEEYPGKVQCRGPRACYDEAKRFGETICHLAWKVRKLPVATVRPFNNYGPGMRLDDGRAPADFARAVRNNRNIEIFSSGAPSRTFCYVADAVYGHLLVLLKGIGDVFNIGSPGPEIQIGELAEAFVAMGKDVCGYTGRIVFANSDDCDYLTHNPQRRCPDIRKAEKFLGYAPSISLHDGIKRYLTYLQEEQEK